MATEKTELPDDTRLEILEADTQYLFRSVDTVDEDLDEIRKKLKSTTTCLEALAQIAEIDNREIDGLEEKVTGLTTSLRIARLEFEDRMYWTRAWGIALTGLGIALNFLFWAVTK